MIQYRCLGRSGTCRNVYPAKEFCIRCKNKPASKDWEIIKQYPNPTPRDLAILSSPNLFSQILEEADKFVPFEEEAKKACILAIVGRLVKNQRPVSFNCILNGVSGSGKDFMIELLLKLCAPKEDWEHEKDPTPKTFKYQGKEADNWENRILYIEDPGQKFLDSEFMKVFVSGNSGKTSSVDEKRQRIVMEIKGKPVVFLTSAETSLNIEGLRRWFIIPIIAKKEKTERILVLQAENDGKTELCDTLNYLNCLNPQTVIIPFGRKLAQLLPTDDTIMLSIHERLRDFIKASACLHQYQRERNEEGHLIATREDYEIVKKVFDYCIGQTIKPITKNDRILLEAIEKAPATKTKIGKGDYGEAIMGETDFKIIKDILPLVSMSKTTAYKQLRRMAETGLISESEVTDNLNRSIEAWKINPSGSKLNLPNWEKISNCVENIENKESLDNIESLESIESSDNPENIASRRIKHEEIMPSESIISEEITPKELV